ncbi:hypothetical protein JW948_00795 [bacterium]|nr:hypothetical protein [bacterium]
MGKGKSFADKLAKASQDYSRHCKECGESIQPVLFVSSEKSGKGDAWRFNQRFVGVCKCNENDLKG